MTFFRSQNVHGQPWLRISGIGRGPLPGSWMKWIGMPSIEQQERKTLEKAQSSRSKEISSINHQMAIARQLTWSLKLGASLEVGC
jgi:hypothetical protein